MEQTFIILKPDTIKRGLVGRIISRFEDKDFKIIDISIRKKTRYWCELMYRHVPKEVFNDLATFMTSAPLIGIILEGDYAISRLRGMVGATNSLAALPGTIRGDFGTFPVACNCIHASDNVEAVEKESKLFFGI